MMRLPVNRLLSRARSRYDKYQQCRETDYIDDAIALAREALGNCTPGHPERGSCLVNVSLYISARYEQLGGMDNLSEAIVLGREALTLCPSGHPLHPICLNNLAADLHKRYHMLGGVDDLYEMISLNREALALFPPGHPDRSMSLNNLASSLGVRYEQIYGLEDLNEEIRLHRDALELRPPGHPDRSMSLFNLAISLGTRYEQLGDVRDLDESIHFNQDALTLQPPGHPLRSKALTVLADNLHLRYQKYGRMEDLDEVIRHARDALALIPPLAGHPVRSIALHNLAAYLFSRYEECGGDLNEVINIGRDALALCPLGHPRRSGTLERLAIHLSSRYKQLHTEGDLEEMFCLYGELADGRKTVSLDDLFGSKAWICAAEEFHHTTMLLAYEVTLRLLVHHLSTLPSLPQHISVLKDLTSSVAVDAFSAGLRRQSPAKAVELLEQGRGVFWSQLTRLRSPLEEVIASGPEGKVLADEYTRVTSLIRETINSSGAGQHDQVWGLNVELEKVISNIRGLPGHSRFLLPLPFSDLRRAASHGPVIIVNASQYSCDAVIVFAEKDPVHIPLTVTKGDVHEWSSRLSAFTERAKKTNAAKDLCSILRELWDRVVCPIAEFLQYVRPLRSRVWWCPTGEFSLLPLHAARPFRKNQNGFSNLFISSYTPTLTALIRARQQHPGPSDSGLNPKRFLAIGQAEAAGENKLHTVSAELTNIGQCLKDLTTFTRIEGKESCITGIKEELGKNEWVHLACHGLANRKKPFESAFALHDGHFTIQQIIGCDLKAPEFAYLSACHTTVGYEDSPDEVIHLASAMQFAGFRSVIGTMWAVDDAQTTKITSVFYTHMTDKSGRLDHRRAAYALWRTMQTPEVDVPFDQRMLYVHIGA